ncbi:MAG: Na+/H+ antiporter NhaC family protein [Bacteroidales bacterium]
MKNDLPSQDVSSKTGEKKLPSLIISIIPVIVLICLLFITIKVFKSDALSGASQVCLLLSTGVICAIAILGKYVNWKVIENGIADKIRNISTALLLLLLIGSLSGAWMVSGVVPTLIYYGVQILHPSYFLVASCIICALVSLVTGSSWTTIATIGVALLGIGQAEGFSEGLIAGTIISGAYFGDKISPLSDTTVLAASTTGTPLFTHIKNMLQTTVPTMLITLIIFTVIGIFHEIPVDITSDVFSQGLLDSFNITPWLLIVPILTAVLIVYKVPALICLFLSVVMGIIAALIFQPDIIREISNVSNYGGNLSANFDLFKGSLISVFGATSINTGVAALNELVSTNGMAGMLNTVWLIICAMCFGGAITASGMLESIMRGVLKIAKNRFSLIGSTVISGLLLNICTADQYISIVLSGSMYGDEYKRRGYKSQLLSRTIEDSVTVTSPLIPWNTCGMTQASILGVATLTYLPFSFFCYLSPITTLIIGGLGLSWGHKKKTNNKQKIKSIDK